MARFRPLADVLKPAQTTNDTGVGLNVGEPKTLIKKEINYSQTAKPLKPLLNSSKGETGGGGAVATRDIFRARLQQVSHDLPVNLAVLVAEFENDEQDIAEHQFDDDTLRKAVFHFVVYQLGLHPVRISTPADDGMVQCRQCGHWWNRCRHPDKYRGRWPEMPPDQWRRCNEYRVHSRI